MVQIQHRYCVNVGIMQFDGRVCSSCVRTSVETSHAKPEGDAHSCLFNTFAVSEERTTSVPVQITLREARYLLRMNWGKSGYTT